MYVDTSCVIALDCLNLLPKLSLLFGEVLIPKAVRDELFKRRTNKDRIQAAERTHDFIRYCFDYDKSSVDMLLSERQRLRMTDRGESEAVVQAAQTGASVLVDDPWGRDLADRYRLEYHGTIWVLKRFWQLGLTPPEELREQVVQLLGRGIRLPRKAIDELLREAGCAPLA